jgi:hypothetical protein
MTKLVTFAVLAASALCAGMTTNAAALGEDLVGTWAWESVENTHSDGAKTQPFGPKPGGYLTFDKSGGFFWLITRPGRAKFASGRRDQGTVEENKATVQGSLAYCGTYLVSNDTLLLKIEASTYPNEEGAEQKRIFTLSGDELSWKNPIVSTGASGVAKLRRVH